MRAFFRVLLCLSFFTAGAALAGGQPFDQVAFDALQREGKPILVSIHADWCPTCKAQEPIVDDLLRTPPLKEITVLRVDFDRQQAVVKRFKAQYQSTLIVFKGGREVGRSTGDTKRESIVALLKKAI